MGQKQPLPKNGAGKTEQLHVKEKKKNRMLPNAIHKDKLKMD